MVNYDKDEIKAKLTYENVFEIVNDFGGDPRPCDFGFISATICHNEAGSGSHKLYYYTNTQLFRCYTGCDDIFDIFELVLKVHSINKPGVEWTLNDAVLWVARRFNLAPSIVEDDLPQLNEWKALDRYDKIVLSEENVRPQLNEYNAAILEHLPTPIIYDWLKEGITQEVMTWNKIAYFPVTEQITIPHFDMDGRFVGLRGRALGAEEAERYGKYRPLVVNGIMYNHALGLNLYNLNNSKENIKKMKKVIIFEGEKSCLLYQSFFGVENDISVACCGSSISSYQMKMLLDLGVTEVIVAFDKQFKEKGDVEFNHLTKNLTAIHNKYNQYVQISFMFDKEDAVLGYKDSPIDCGKEKFLYLFKNRIML